MNYTLRVFIIVSLVVSTISLRAQEKSIGLPIINNTDNLINRIKDDSRINADSAFRLLSDWSVYPDIAQSGKDYLCYYTDPFFGKIPFRVYVPSGYRRDMPNTCVLLLHGAVGGSKFSDIDTVAKFDDLIFSLLKKRQYIIIRPVADPAKKFDWVVDKFKGTPNVTFEVLANMLTSVKRILNIDDNKVFAFGHSDGADGSIGMGVYEPDQFAGVIAYNSMLNNIFAPDFYIRNIINTPLYDVHSDLDELRPIQQNRLIMNELKKIDSNIIYKEYIGYQHYDKHLDRDIPYTAPYINSISRNPFKTNIYWETDSSNIYKSCNWLKITAVNDQLAQAAWCQELHVRTYDKRLKQIISDQDYYPELHKAAVVKASFNNNTFNIETSEVSAIELQISPVMVNMEQPVTVMINGKQVFSGKVIADKQFITDGFKANFDRGAIWVTSLKLKVN